ncbi:Endochitinase 1 [Blyttiomyces sp. JEL0837]|nr:Endochitinase 1 [Blyttiomyces sp. JEL0837]
MAEAGYSYDEQKRVLYSYDTVEAVRKKCQYVWEKGLKGVIVWESSGDFRDSRSSRSLTKALWEGLSGVGKQ